MAHCGTSSSFDFSRFDLPNLRYMKLLGQYPSAVVREYLLCASTLTILHLESVLLNDTDLLACCSRENQLEELSLYACTNVAALAVAVWASKCVHLQYSACQW